MADIKDDPLKFVQDFIFDKDGREERMYADMATKFDYGMYTYPTFNSSSHIRIETNDEDIAKALHKGSAQPIPLFGKFFYSTSFDIKYEQGLNKVTATIHMLEVKDVGVTKNEDAWWQKKEVLVQRCEDGTLNIIFENGFYKANPNFFYEEVT